MARSDLASWMEEEEEEVGKQITLTIDCRTVTTEEGQTVLEAARKAGIEIPTLCYHPDLQVRANCRLCVVEVAGARSLQASCSTEAREGMVVQTNTPAIRQAREVNLSLILANHPQECLGCIRNRTCELQTVTEQLGGKASKWPVTSRLPVDASNPSIVRDSDKCILCRRCVEVCHEVQTVGAIGPINRGLSTHILPPHGSDLEQVGCVFCGQCVAHCPVGALYEKDDTAKVWRALADPESHVIVQVAPAVRVSIGEEMGLAPGTNLEGQVVSALRRIGFRRVFDATFTADLTIMEEGIELVQRLSGGGTLPMFTSCCPAWVRFAENFYPDFLPNLSTCKSPQQMLGALAKTYYGREADIDPARIVMVSIMPCVAKKSEACRPELRSSGFQDVDYVLTTRELGRMLRSSGVRLDALEPEQFDDPLGISSGAGVIFGATGGVMEAALRTGYHLITGEELGALDLEEVRGFDGIREATVRLGSAASIRVAVAHGLARARALIEKLKAGEVRYDFVEVMACPGGCIGGAGQPYGSTMKTVAQRMAAIYQGDRDKAIRCSHHNPAVKQLYARYLGQPLGARSHHLLHTHYTARRVLATASRAA